MSERPEFPPIESAPSRHIWIWALAGAALVVGLIWVARRAPAPAAVRPAAAMAAIAEVKPAAPAEAAKPVPAAKAPERDRKSTRLNSSHLVISYAVFCLKK